MNSNLFTPNKSLNISDSFSFNVEKNSIHDLKTAKDSRSPSLEETECTHNLISRKTLRGRKEKIPLPKNKLKCEICLKFSDFSEEDLLSCSTCKCFFHKSCYDQFELYENSTYKCIRCSYALKENKSINDYKCFICGNSNGVLNRNSLTKCFYHKICVDLLNEFIGLEGEDICKEKIRKWRYKNSCRYCGEKLSKAKVVIKCKNPKCKEYYHIPCAIEKGMIFDLKYMKEFYNVSSYEEIPFFCSNHNKKIAFLYKSKVANGFTNDIKCRKNLFFNEVNITENEENGEKKTFLEFFEDFSENKLNENNITNFRNKKEKTKKKFIQENNKDLSIIEEKKENSFIQKENEEKETDLFMDIDDSFEINKNNAFKLDFEKIFKENDENEAKIEDELLSNESFDCEGPCHDLCRMNSNFPGNKCDNCSFSRQYSFNSLDLII